MNLSPYHPFRIFQLDPNWRKKIEASRRTWAKPLAVMRRDDGAGVAVVDRPIAPDEYFMMADDQTELQGLFWKASHDLERVDRFSQYWFDSRQVVAFDPQLAAALSHTNISDVPCSEVRLPLDSFYLSWGDAPRIRYTIQDRAYLVEGAYIQRLSKPSILFPEGSLHIEFASRRVFTAENTVVRPDRHTIMLEPVDCFQINLGSEANIGTAISQGIEDYTRYLRTMDAQLPHSVRSIALELGIPHRLGPPLTPGEDRFVRGRERIERALPILFNCLFYLTQRPEDESVTFTKTPPPNLVRREKNATTEPARVRVQREMSDKGYHRIRFVSNPSLQWRPPPADSPVETKLSLAPHIRRGHWARQTYGQGAALRKWIWRMPTLVNAQSGPITTGVIRDVRPQVSP